eukprot:Nk52_evm40s156 gene=Nk52_evmTU40s156
MARKLEITPVPWKLLGSALFAFLAESISITVLFPFVTFMVRDFGVTDKEEDLGIYVGTIESAFTFCQFLTSGLWGGLSDKIGRRPVILIGLFGNTVCCALFGMSPNLPFAIAVRGINGLVNGNFGVLRVYVREISDKTNQAICFALFGFIFGIGLVAGPMIGGLFTNPTEHLPWLFAPGSIWDTKPYLLPCVFSATMSTLAFINAYLFMKETKGKTAPPPKPTSSPTENTSLLSGAQGGSIDNELAEERIPSLKEVLMSKNVFLNISVYGLLSYVIICSDGTFPVYSVYSIDKHGLGFDSRKIFYFVSISGIGLIIFQWFIFHRIERLLGASIILRIASAGISVYVFSIPFLNDVIQYNYALFWVCSAFLQIFGRACCVAALFTCNALLTNNATEHHLGAVNGVMASVAALARSFGPFMGGWLLTLSMKSTLPFPFNYHFLYNWLTMFGLLMMFCAFKLPRSLDTKYTHDDIEEESEEEALIDGREGRDSKSRKFIRKPSVDESISQRRNSLI